MSSEKKIILIRHGEAAFSKPDKERILSPKGIADSQNLGMSLENELENSFQIFCSTARRTRQTFEGLNQFWKLHLDQVDFADDLYESEYQAYVARVESSPADSNVCVIIGHNPAISYFGASLSKISYMSFQPGEARIFASESEDWSSIRAREWELIKSFSPKNA